MVAPLYESNPASSEILLLQIFTAVKRGRVSEDARIDFTGEYAAGLYSGGEGVAYLLDDGVHVKDTNVSIIGGYVHGR